MVNKALLAQRILLIFTLTVSTFTAKSTTYQAGNYPRMAYATYGNGKVVANTSNIIKDAFENHQVVQLKYTPKWRQAMSHTFYEIADIGSYELELFASREFVQGALRLVKEFSYTEYRFRHQAPATDVCNGQAYDKQTKENMPFVGGQYKQQKMEVNYPLHSNKGLLYQFYLKSGTQAPLKSIWGSVHEVGPFFGKTADRNDLILTVNVIAYYQTENGLRGEKLFPQGSVFLDFITFSKRDRVTAFTKESC